jgi:hypothetical protein
MGGRWVGRRQIQQLRKQQHQVKVEDVQALMMMHMVMSLEQREKVERHSATQPADTAPCDTTAATAGAVREQIVTNGEGQAQHSAARFSAAPAAAAAAAAAQVLPQGHQLLP